MNPKQLADEFYGMAHDAAMNVMDIIQQESTCRCDMEHSYNEKGIRIDFMFRSEIDYSLIVPWEYTQNDNMIRDYFKRFITFIEPGETISDVSRLAQVFIENEFFLLRGK